MTVEELNAMFRSDRPEERSRAAGYLVEKLTSQDAGSRAQGHELLGAAFNDALYQSCLNYRSLVGGFTHPLLDVVRRSVELWAQAGRRCGD